MRAGRAGAWLARIAPSELLLRRRHARLRAAPGRHARADPPPGLAVRRRAGPRKLLEQLQAASLAAWGAEDLPLARRRRRPADLRRAHQGRALTHVHALAVQRDGELIELPATTRRNLELVRPCAAKTRPRCSRCSTPA
jgi:DNA mismatch repair protein MutS